MVLKRHEDKPWEWEDSICFLTHHGKSDCDGVMELKDVVLKKPITQSIVAPHLEKIWVCNKCGHVFVE